MNERPTREQVDAALATHVSIDPGHAPPRDWCCVLAAEVRALQEENERLRLESASAVKPVLRAHIRELEATIARVDTLCRLLEENPKNRQTTQRVMAEWIRAALRGES